MTKRAVPIALGAILMQLAAADAAARTCPPISFGKAYATADEAAAATLRALLMQNAPYESGGFLVEKDGRFRASRPVTQRSRSRVDYCIAVPRGAQLAGLYHTHVANPELSARDRRNAERAAVPTYVGTLRDGSARVYDPRRMRGLGASSDATVLAARTAAPAPAAPTGWRAAVATVAAWADAARRALLESN